METSSGQQRRGQMLEEPTHSKSGQIGWPQGPEEPDLVRSGGEQLMGGRRGCLDGLLRVGDPMCGLDLQRRDTVRNRH